MYKRKKQSSAKFYLTFFILLFIGMMIFANKWIQTLMDNLFVKVSVQRKIDALERKNEENRRRMLKGDFIRKIRMNPNRTNSESRIYHKGEIIAEYNTVIKDDIENVRGVIPEGRVSFINETKETYGEEHYQKGKRHGMYREFYSNGVMYRQAKFYRGKLMKNAIYYFDGTPRRLEDFTDALRFVEDPEIGYGRIFYRDGTLMYEWNLTNILKGGYKKSYNTKGELVEEKIYDNIGDLVEVINHGYRLTDSRYQKK